MIDETSYIYFSNKALQLSKKLGGFIQYLKQKQSANPQSDNPPIK
jgi:hypothetical protein